MGENEGRYLERYLAERQVVGAIAALKPRVSISAQASRVLLANQTRNKDNFANYHTRTSASNGSATFMSGLPRVCPSARLLVGRRPINAEKPSPLHIDRYDFNELVESGTRERSTQFQGFPSGCVPPKRAFQGRIAKRPICDRRPRFGMAVAGPDLSRGGQPLGLGCRGRAAPIFPAAGEPFLAICGGIERGDLSPSLKQYAVPRPEYLSP